MKTEFVITADGSHTLFVKKLNEHYHSTFGAIQEAQHIFIESGFNFVKNNLEKITILEIGFGTGLNAFLTLLNSYKNNIPVCYTAIEAFPIEKEIYEKLNFAEHITNTYNLEDSHGLNYKKIFLNLHTQAWNITANCSDIFQLKKIPIRAQDFNTKKTFDLIYFDAFAPDIQPELWTENIFCMLYNCLNTGGTLVTYSCKGSVRRTLITVGFSVFKIPGPTGKREIVRAIKM